MDAALAALLKEHAAHLELDSAASRVKCRLSGHTMVARTAIVQQYVGGKKFAALRGRQEELESLKQFEPHIVPSKFCSGFLFCRITGKLVPAKEAAVVRHSDGKNFRVQCAFVEAGAGLKNEMPPAEKAQPAAAETQMDADAEAGSEEAGPGIWEPPRHVLESDGDDSSEDDVDLDEPEEDVPPKRKAAASKPIKPPQAKKARK